MTMHPSDLAEIVLGLRADGITVWIDGGWCVDLLVGRQTRPHDDLDLAADRADDEKLRGWFHAHAYADVPRADATPWNYVLGDGAGRQVDIHAFGFGADGQHVYGIAYPRESLTGSVELDGVPVPCIAAEWMFRFKTAYPPAPKDLADVRALHDALGFEIPPSHTG